MAGPTGEGVVGAFELTPLFGRDLDLESIQAHIEAGSRLLTLTGPPGAGKTRLARETVRGLLQRGSWSGRMTFCGLRAASSEDDIVSIAAAALEVPLGDQLSSRETADRVLDHLAQTGRRLLVLDNAEHLIQAVRSLVGLWLEHAPDLVVLVTSREALEHPAEVCHLVAPLAVPSGIDDALTTPAVQLFVRCAANLAVQVPVSPAELGDLVALVTRLDGNPLAIELAAARSPLLSPKAILKRLERRFEVLSQNPAGRAGLWDAINASWESLTRPEQRALMQLALFRGGASVESFEALLEADKAYDGQSGLDLLGGLLRKSLITSTPSPTLPTVRRIDLYESIREFALERLAESSRSAVAGSLGPMGTSDLQRELTGRYVEWVLSTLSRYDSHKGGAHAASVHLELASELSNMLAGLALATSPGAPAHWWQGAAKVLLEGHRMLVRFLPLDRMERIIAGTTVGETFLDLETRIRLSAVHATYLAFQDDLDQASVSLEKAVALALTSGEPAMEGLALKGFAAVVTYLEADPIIARLERALELLGGPRWSSDIGNTRAALARLYARKRQFERSDKLFAAAISELAAPADTMALGWALSNWSATFVLRSDWDEARTLLGRALELSRRSYLRLLEAATLCGLGEAELKANRRSAAKALFAEGLAISQAAGYRRHGAVAAGYLAAIAHLDNDPATAIVNYDEALSMLGHEWDAVLARGLIVSARSLALAHLGDAEASDAGFLQARPVLENTGDEALVAAHRIHRLTADFLLGRRPQAGVLDDAKAVAASVESDGSALRLSHIQHAMSLLEMVLAVRSSAVVQVCVSIGVDTSFMALEDGTHLDLRRSPKTRRLVALLVERRTSSPGVSVTVHDLFDAAWPDDRTPEPHRSNRVYVALTRLRNAGFTEIIQHDGDGYLLDPHIAVVTRES